MNLIIAKYPTINDATATRMSRAASFRELLTFTVRSQNLGAGVE